MPILMYCSLPSGWCIEEVTSFSGLRNCSVFDYLQYAKTEQKPCGILSCKWWCDVTSDLESLLINFVQGLETGTFKKGSVNTVHCLVYSLLINAKFQNISKGKHTSHLHHNLFEQTWVVNTLAWSSVLFDVFNLVYLSCVRLLLFLYTTLDIKWLIQYCKAGIFRRAKFSRKANFSKFIYWHTKQVAIVYTRDTRNGDLCQVVQYYGYGQTR